MCYLKIESYECGHKLMTRSGCAVDNPDCCIPVLCTYDRQNYDDEICELCKERAVNERREVDEEMARRERMLEGNSQAAYGQYYGSDVQGASTYRNSSTSMTGAPNPNIALDEAEAAILAQRIVMALRSEVEPTEASKTLSALPTTSSDESEHTVTDQYGQNVERQVPSVEDDKEVAKHNNEAQTPGDQTGQ